MVSGLLSVDLVILLTWQFSDPLQRRLESFPLEDPLSSNDDIKIRPELEHCESENNSVWLGKYLMLCTCMCTQKNSRATNIFNKYFRLKFIYDSNTDAKWNRKKN